MAADCAMSRLMIPPTLRRHSLYVDLYLMISLLPRPKLVLRATRISRPSDVESQAETAPAADGLPTRLFAAVLLLRPTPTAERSSTFLPLFFECYSPPHEDQPADERFELAGAAPDYTLSPRVYISRHSIAADERSRIAGES